MNSDLIIRRVVTEGDWAEVVRIRTRVFVEEQACSPDDEWDEHDAPEARFSTCRHFLGEIAGTAVATARWHPFPFERQLFAKLERFAVLPESRGQGFGKAMITHVVTDARESGFDNLILHAQAYLEKLYEGFGLMRAGDVFDEVGIPHVKMISIEEA